MKVPVLGQMRPSFLSTIPAFDTGFDEFDTPTMHGLARVVGNHLDILAIDAHVPGRGDCGRFLAECIESYERVRILFIGNPQLDQMLRRRGWEPFVAYEDGEIIEGRQWKKV